MARRRGFYFLFILILVDQITTMFVSDEQNYFKRHIGSARDKIFRAKPTHSNQQANIFQRQHQPLPSPEVLRSIWTNLFNQQRQSTTKTLSER